MTDDDDYQLQAPPRKRSFLRRALWFMVPLLLILAILFWPARHTMTIQTEVTYVTDPIGEDGLIDFQSAMNRHWSKGIQPDENAMVLFWAALGPRPEGGNGMPKEYFEWLGAPEPPEMGDYLLSSDSYLRNTRQVTPQEMVYLSKRYDYTQKAPWSALEFPEVAELLQKNEMPLEVIHQASLRPKYYNPLVAPNGSLISALMPQITKMRDTVRPFTSRAMLHLHAGKTDLAWKDLITCHRVGRHMQQGASLIEYLLGITFEQIAINAELVFLEHGKLTQSQVMACLQDIRGLRPIALLADKLDFGERFMFLDAVREMVKSGAADVSGMENNTKKNEGFLKYITSRSVNWDNGLIKANKFYTETAEVLRIKDRVVRNHEMKRVMDELVERKNASSVSQFIGSSKQRGEAICNFLISLLFPAIDKVRAAEDRIQQSALNVELAFALKAYRIENGRYPEKLSELCPKYFAQEPLDLYTGKPLIYRLEGEGYLLYSVGENGQDDNGVGFDDNPRGDDNRVRMPGKPPEKPAPPPMHDDNDNDVNKPR